jgi:hypothetical protein
MKKLDFETVESEIRKEKAEALGRAGERLERALHELETFRQEAFGLFEAAQESGRDGQGWFFAGFERKLAEYARLCDQTEVLRLALIIQREAVGLWGREDVDRQYPPPGPLTLSAMTRLEGDR